MVTSQMRMYCSKVTCVPGRSLLLVSLSFVVVSATPAKPYEVAPYIIGGNLKQRLMFMFNITTVFTFSSRVALCGTAVLL